MESCTHQPASRASTLSVITLMVPPGDPRSWLHNRPGSGNHKSAEWAGPRQVSCCTGSDSELSARQYNGTVTYPSSEMGGRWFGESLKFPICIYPQRDSPGQTVFWCSLEQRTLHFSGVVVKRRYYPHVPRYISSNKYQGAVTVEGCSLISLNQRKNTSTPASLCW